MLGKPYVALSALLWPSRVLSGPVLASLLLCGALGAACHKTPKPSLVPPQTVEMDDETLKKFQEEIEEYVHLRKKAVAHVPPAGPQSTPEELTARQRALTQAIIGYRKHARRGEIFKRSVEAAVRRTLDREFKSANGPDILKEIRQGNPRVEGNPLPRDPTKEVKQAVTLAVNAPYPDAAPFSNMPPSLLLKLPVLPDEVRYRFVGRALILRDTEANVILDFIPDVVPDPTLPR